MVELIQVSEAGDDPLSTAEAKEWLRVDEANEDDLIEGLCTAARSTAEEHTSRTLLASRVFKYTTAFPRPYGIPQHLDACAYMEMVLPRGPLVSIDSVKIDGISVDSSAYSAEVGESKLLPVLKFTDASVSGRMLEVQFTTGTEAPPVNALLAMKFMVGHWYTNRESQEMPKGAAALLDKVRLL